MAIMAKKRTRAVKSWRTRMKDSRNRLGLAQQEAAERVSISQSQWSAFESGKRRPTRPIARLLELLEDGTI